MSEHDELIDRAAARAGIAATYKNAVGETFRAGNETKRAILAALGFRSDGLTAGRESLHRLDTLLAAALPPVIVAKTNRAAEIVSRPGPGTRAAEWRLEGEDGTIVTGRASIDRQGRSICKLGTLAMGYYRLTLGAGADAAHATLIAAPPQCWKPDWLASDARAWGVAAQVYGLRSEDDFGIGDFSCIADAAHGAGGLGASFLGLSPLHALFASDRHKISPYSPSSRLFLETIFVDPTAIRRFAGSKAANLLDDPSFRTQLSSLRQTRLVDYEGSWRLKLQMLEKLWEELGDGDQSGLAAFRRTLGEPLELHATFEALSEHFRAQGHDGSADWRAAYRAVHSEEVNRFRQECAARISFHAWLQFLADTQFGAAAQAARLSGMEIGLYRDLAVGADPGGSEVWANPERFAPDLSIGAPPDALSPKGQDWGLPPFHPLVLQSQGLAAFRDLVAANMRHAGAIRIDHAFQLRRLFLIPRGLPSSLGTYVEYPLEAMLAVLGIESHRAQCAVIGEDLGNPPQGFSEAIIEAGMLGYRVVPFERRTDGMFKPPQKYARETLAVVTTHDLPTLKGWWRGLDIDLRECFGVYDATTAQREHSLRQDECRQFVVALENEGIAPFRPDGDGLAEAAFRFLARTGSALAGVQFEDIIDEVNQANLPGLADGPPNWRRRLDLPVSAIVAPGGPLARAAALFAEEGRGPRARLSRLAAPPPSATYRLQFHAGFTFDDAISIIPYLASLGISHVYASPIEAAAPGSQHGYDVIDHTRINPELGGEEGFTRFADALRRSRLGLIVDIVPNHMGIADGANPWWQSVLEWGELSPYATTFDIDWDRPGAHHRLVLPVLAAPYGEMLEKGELKLVFDETQGSFSIHYHDNRFPICPLSYDQIIEPALLLLDGREALPLSKLAKIPSVLRERVEADQAEAVRNDGERLKQNLAAIAKSSAKTAAAIRTIVDRINGRTGSPASFDRLHFLLEAQAYRLVHWRNAASEINYRRFFDINTLAGIRPEEPGVFKAVHALVFRLVDDGLIQGLRIDHIDGLADPLAYLCRLQSRLGPGFFVVVEKIFSSGERFRPWPVAGSTGYDALNTIDRVFVAPESRPAFDRAYQQVLGHPVDYARELRAAKLEVLRNSFGSELSSLVLDLTQMASSRRDTRDLAGEALNGAVAELIAAFPVYRTYIGEDGHPSPEDRSVIEQALRDAKQSGSSHDPAAFDYIANVLLGPESEDLDPQLGHKVRRFRRRFQQVSGPIMAKGLEDTLFYRYRRFVALNEVGGDPDRFGESIAHFHEANRQRAKSFPHSLLASATHDTKRGEDMRARLLALSTIPDEWQHALGRWKDFEGLDISAPETPNADDLYLLLQTILGAWPLELLDGGTADEFASFATRLKDYMRKALREAKQFSSWSAPNEPYETAICALIDQLIAPQSSFIDSHRPLARRLAFLGMLIGLARTILKCTLPGIPDIYQGTELWDLSLVDPDNRRPVDYRKRQALLDERPSFDECAADWRDGRIKQFVLQRLLADRAAHPDLYAFGDYRPVAEREPHAAFVAFERTFGGARLFVAVLRQPGAKVEHPTFPLPASAFHGLDLTVPAGKWRNLLSGQAFVSDGYVAAADHLEGMPALVLRDV